MLPLAELVNFPIDWEAIMIELKAACLETEFQVIHSLGTISFLHEIGQYCFELGNVENDLSTRFVSTIGYS